MLHFVKMPVTNRNKVSNYFITFPRWTEVDMQSIADKLPKMSYYIIVKEFHDDNDKDVTRNSMIHYHISLILKQGLPFKKFLDWIKREWPEDWKRVKLETTKSFDDSVDYLTKESKDYIIFGEKDKKKMSAKYEKLLKEYEDHLEFKRLNPSEFAITRDRLQQEEVERLQSFVRGIVER